MRRLNIVKTCTILGAILALIYLVFVMLAPNFKVGTSRMLIPEMLLPKPAEAVAPGTPVPTSVKVKRVVIGAVFFLPFGAMVGLGVGLLLDGAGRTIRDWRRKK